LSVDEMVELVKIVDGFGVPGDAISYAERALELYPESTKALVTLADLIKSDQKDRALELLNRAVAFEPNEPTIYVARGWCYFWAHSNAMGAESDFRKAIELSKGSLASAWLGLGDTLARKGQGDEAVVAYLKYLSLRPNSAAHYDGEVRKSIKMLKSNSSHP
jgi:tetratricopeptide (TPR) repeat protein